MKLDGMAESKKGKETLIVLSSSEEEGEDEVFDESENEEEDDDYDDDDDDDDESDNDEEEDNDCDDESLCNEVVRLLKERCDLDSLTLKECKAYLRKNGLRLTGIKTVCIQRIKEHWRLKDGNGEALYPRPSFFINCTGDVCKGDVVLFTQKVYEKFDKVTRHGRVLGKRTVAGRVVKESYGANKQQHTFTVEVLWSNGFKKLPPLFPLLVKGRNLYKLKTFRQRWDNEEKRQGVLAEKHKRGFEARLVRAMRKKKWAENGGAKSTKKFNSMRPSQMKRSTKSRERDFDKAKSLGFVSSDNHRRDQDVFPTRHRHQNVMPRGSRCSRGHKKSFHQNRGVTTPYSSFNSPQIHQQSQIESEYRNVPYPFVRSGRDSAQDRPWGDQKSFHQNRGVTTPYSCFNSPQIHQQSQIESEYRNVPYPFVWSGRDSTRDRPNFYCGFRR